MPTLVMINVKDGMDSSMNKKAYAFLEKLRADDTLPGLHIEPIQSAADPRVRTGRVDRNFRAVLFKVDSSFGPVYGFYGIWPHNKAIEIGRGTGAKAAAQVPTARRARPSRRRTKAR